jgi:hypothetical protein
MGKYQMPVLIVKFYSEHSIGQRFFYHAFNFDSFFFSHASIYTSRTLPVNPSQ